MEAKRYLDAGDLVPAELTNKLVEDRIRAADAADGFILDGFPRSVEQAQALDEMLKNHDTKLDAVLEFAVSEEELFERLKSRGRADDTEEVIRNRMQVYRDETEPLLEYYRAQQPADGRRGGRAGRGVRPGALRALGRLNRRSKGQVSMIGLPGLRNRKVVAQRSAGELDAMAAAGSLVAAALLAVQQAAAPGVSTLALDEIAEAVIRDGGGIPSFLGYHGFPASICASVNDRVVHGIPSATETLALGDLVSIDCGAILDGWHGDSAITFGIGTLIPVDEALSQATREAMEAGIAAMLPGNRLTDVSHAIEVETHAAEARYDRKFGIVAGYGGHGIGRQMHMDPFLPNEGAPGRGPHLAPGSVLAIEPMLTLGTTKTVVLEDEWTVVTADGPAPRTGSTPSPSRTTARESSRCSTDLQSNSRGRSRAARSNEPDHRQRRIKDGGW